MFIARTMKYAERSRWRSVEEAFWTAVGKVKNAAKQTSQEFADGEGADVVSVITPNAWALFFLSQLMWFDGMAVASSKKEERSERPSSQQKGSSRAESSIEVRFLTQSNTVSIQCYFEFVSLLIFLGCTAFQCDKKVFLITVSGASGCNLRRTCCEHVTCAKRQNLHLRLPSLKGV